MAYPAPTGAGLLDFKTAFCHAQCARQNALMFVFLIFNCQSTSLRIKKAASRGSYAKPQGLALLPKCLFVTHKVRASYAPAGALSSFGFCGVLWVACV